MREISAVEMNQVSGAYSWSFDSGLLGLAGSAISNVAEAVSSVALGTAIGAMGGTLIGGKHGGDGGGLLGVGSIGQGVGAVVGALAGGIGCGIGAALVGWDTTLEYAKKGVDGIINGTVG